MTVGISLDAMVCAIEISISLLQWNNKTEQKRSTSLLSAKLHFFYYYYSGETGSSPQTYFLAICRKPSDPHSFKSWFRLQNTPESLSNIFQVNKCTQSYHICQKAVLLIVVLVMTSFVFITFRLKNFFFPFCHSASSNTMLTF